MDLGPARYYALCTGSVFSDVRLTWCRAVDIRPRWPSQMFENASSVLTKIDLRALQPLHIATSSDQYFWRRL